MSYIKNKQAYQDLASFSEVVANIYAAALNQARWPAALAGVASLLDAASVAMHTPKITRADGGFVYLHAAYPVCEESWLALHPIDNILFRAMADGGFFRDGMVKSADELLHNDELHSSNYHRDYLAPNGFAQVAIAIVFDGQSAGSTEASLWVFKSQKAEQFSQQHRDLLQLLIGHVTQALNTSTQFFANQVDRNINPAAPLVLEIGVLRARYTLTKAEVALAEQILTGQSLQEIAVCLGKSNNTVKKHMQNLFYKTGTNRQAELMRLLMLYVAVPERPPSLRV